MRYALDLIVSSGSHLWKSNNLGESFIFLNSSVLISYVLRLASENHFSTDQNQNENQRKPTKAQRRYGENAQAVYHGKCWLLSQIIWYKTHRNLQQGDLNHSYSRHTRCSALLRKGVQSHVPIIYNFSVKSNHSDYNSSIKLTRCCLSILKKSG